MDLGSEIRNADNSQDAETVPARVECRFLGISDYFGMTKQTLRIN